MRFENTVAVVAGAASGIGYVAAQRLASEGAMRAWVDSNGRLVCRSASTNRHYVS
jgi:NAD(P)-dependent dehydrogenase (short-subunit alcohol dehydrogenase family)